MFLRASSYCTRFSREHLDHIVQSVFGISVGVVKGSAALLLAPHDPPAILRHLLPLVLVQAVLGLPPGALLLWPLQFLADFLVEILIGELRRYDVYL